MDISPNISWIAPQPDRLPDFIIGGAMKSGTTTLHAMLEQHPEIGFAHEELGFFDMDSLTQHADFNRFDSKQGQWITQKLDENPKLFWNWYFSKFDIHAPVKGEDSTTYLASASAAKRIALQTKPIKLIFVLRHPTSRTVSHYLHHVKSGRALYSLEDTLRYNPFSILQRSLYKTQLEAYYAVLPPKQIHVVLFEDLVSDPETVMASVCTFIGVDFKALPSQAFSIHSNKTKVPKSLGLQLKRNRLLHGFHNHRYTGFLPNQGNFNPHPSIMYRIVDRFHKYINPISANVEFKPNPDTLRVLDDFFKVEFEGIDTLVKQDIFRRWFNT